MVKTPTLRAVAIAGVLLIASGCNGTPSDDEGSLDPPAASYQPPQYAAQAPGGLLVRRGSKSRSLHDVVSAEWLADGRYLVRIEHREPCPGGAPDACGPRPAFVLDPGSGELTRVGMGLGDDTVELPVATVWGLSWLTGPHQGTLSRLNPDLSRRLPDLKLPPVDGQAEARYFGETVTIGDATFIEFSDVIADHNEEYGYLRVVGDEVEKVLLGQRIADLWVSADGRALLGTQQLHGDPCGGCIVDQQIVEIDPITGEITEEYGVPDGYDEWGVHAIDKVDGRVAVRYGGTAGDRVELWVHDDGTWSLDDAGTDVLTWWQGPDDRLELRPDPAGGRDQARLFWVHGDEETALPGENSPNPMEVPGSLLPPVG